MRKKGVSTTSKVTDPTSRESHGRDNVNLNLNVHGTETVETAETAVKMQKRKVTCLQLRTLEMDKKCNQKMIVVQIKDTWTKNEQFICDIVKGNNRE